MLADYLAEGPYRFQMTFGRGTFAEFYQGTDRQLLEERRRWLRECTERHLAVLPECGPLLDEAAALGAESGTLDSAIRTIPDLEGRARAMGENWEPDYLLLTRAAGGIRLVGGCVCFPSSWALNEKVGRPIEDIHGVVPDLNATIGRQIRGFLEKLRPGVSWTRSNWGLSRSAELNQHPARKLPRLDPSVSAGEVFFRVEEQSLVALPRTGGILFGIRLKIVPLQAFFGTAAGAKLVNALRTMPEATARYKGLDLARGRIIQLLDQAA